MATSRSKISVDETEIPFVPALELLKGSNLGLSESDIAAIGYTLATLVPGSESHSLQLDNWQTNAILCGVSRRLNT